jgi:hypothetical protein
MASWNPQQPGRCGGDGYVRAFRIVVWGLVAFLLVGTGCMSKDPHGRQSVTGTVIFHGQPLDAGSIEFLPPNPNHGVSAHGLIQNGRFVIPRSQGVPPGTYRVLISSPEPDPKAEPVGGPGMQMPPLGRDRIPATYNRESQVTVVVRADEANHFDFTID